MALMQDSYVPSQRLLFPDIIDIAPSDAQLMPDLIPELMRLGIDIALLGPNVASISGIPSGLEGLDPSRLLADLIAAARQTDATHAGDTLRSRLALALARNAAIPVGQALSSIEMSDLMQQLFATDSPAITPDGKTIIATLPTADIERLF